MPQDTNNKTNAAAPVSTFSQEDFDKMLTSSMMGLSQMVSSADTQLEERLNKSIAGVEKSQEASKGYITSVFDREKELSSEIGKKKLTSAVESQRGYAQNTAVLKQIEQDTDKSIKDLEQRKQELILQGEAASASKIADLQFQAEEFRQKSRQQVFSNLLAFGNYGLQRQESARAERAQNFQERSAIGSIALQFGIKVNENDTIDDVINNAAQFANAQQKAQLAKLQAETRYTNAQIRKLEQGMDFELDDNTLAVIAGQIDSGLRSNDETMKTLAQTRLAKLIETKGEKAMPQLIGKIKELRNQEFSTENLTKDITQGYADGKTYGDIINAIDSDLSKGIITTEQAEEANKIAKKLKPASQRVTYPGLLKDLYGFTLGGYGAAGSFIAPDIIPESAQEDIKKFINNL